MLFLFVKLRKPKTAYFSEVKSWKRWYTALKNVQKENSILDFTLKMKI
jgi:hypothetical protein